MPQVLRAGRRPKTKNSEKMKKIILSAMVFSLAFAVKAQEIPDRKTDRPGMMERKKHHQGMGMDLKALNLTEDQKAKFKTQNENFRKQMEDLKKNDDITVRDWKAKAETIRKARKESMQSILTSDQKAQIQKMKEQGKARQEDMKKRMADRMKTELNLTADQSSKLEANHKAIGEEMKKIRENSSLTDEQKRDQMKSLHQKQKENLKSILTPEQMEKMKEKRKNHEDRRPGDFKKKPEVDKTI
jgi:Spy/CpxP family protein refolding chaperone